MIALSDQIVADGNGSPWCISIESEAADGWVATDWMEDILLRTAPPEIYTQWYNHEIPFNHPEVLEAAEYMHQIWFTDGYAYGGSDLHQRRPSSATHRTRCSTRPAPSAGCRSRQHGSPDSGARTRTSRDPAEWPNQPGEDVGFFYFPTIEEEFGSPVLGAA